MQPDGTSSAISSAGTYFGTGDGGSPEDYGELAEVVSIGGPTETAEEIDVTHLRSPGRYREFIQSYLDAGELPLELNFVPGSASQSALRDEYNTGIVKSRRIFYPDGTTDTFDAFVKGRGKSASVGTKLALNITLRIVGGVTTVDVIPSPQPD